MTKKLAFIDNKNEVVTILYTDETSAQSYVNVVKIVDITSNTSEINLGDVYDGTTGAFSLPPTPSTEAIPTN